MKKGFQRWKRYNAKTISRPHILERYIVQLPKREEAIQNLCHSRELAIRQFSPMERRFEKNEKLKNQYVQFMQEYLELGNMRTVPPRKEDEKVYYLPHHAVSKLSDEGRKIRVVFNASTNTSSGISLNDCLLSGPKLHEDLWHIINRWRLFKFAFTTDIVKMFRQIRISEDDQNLQRIVWRFDKIAPLQYYELTKRRSRWVQQHYVRIRTWMIF